MQPTIHHHSLPPKPFRDCICSNAQMSEYHPAHVRNADLLLCNSKMDDSWYSKISPVNKTAPYSFINPFIFGLKIKDLANLSLTSLFATTLFIQPTDWLPIILSSFKGIYITSLFVFYLVCNFTCSSPHHEIMNFVFLPVLPTFWKVSTLNLLQGRNVTLALTRIS